MRQKIWHFQKILVIAGILICLACSPTQDAGDNNDDQNGNDNDNRLYLTATLPASVPGGGQVTGVILATENSQELVAVSGVELDIDLSLKKGKAVGVVFVGEDNRAVGVLRFQTTNGGDLYLLPLFNIETGEISLGTITFGQTAAGVDVADPEFDPIGPGEVIDMAESEKSALALSSSVMGNLVANSDANGNGTIDFLEDKIYRFAFQYHIDAGIVPEYVAGDATYSAYIFSKSTLYGFYTHAGVYNANGLDWWNAVYPIVFPDTWNIAWPRGPYTATSFTRNSAGINRQTHYPTDGTYIVTITGDGEVSFPVDSQDTLLNQALIPIPSYHVENGMLGEITWSWRNQNNLDGEDVDSSFLIKRLIIQINDAQETYVRIYNSEGGGLYDWEGETLTGDEGEHVLGRADVPWIDCDRIDFAYFDQFGNHYVMQFKRQTSGN